jgi:[ribosomal protein S5]-alanine N-acetyltransferase
MDYRDLKLAACARDGSIPIPCERGGDIDDACRATAQLYEQIGFEPPWIGYVAIASGVAVGGGAFVGPPSENRVEIAYFTSPQHEGRGVATQTAGHLVEIARSTAPGIELYAKTMPETNASTRILTKLGFEQVGIVTDHEIGDAWAWLLK